MNEGYEDGEPKQYRMVESKVCLVIKKVDEERRQNSTNEREECLDRPY